VGLPVVRVPISRDFFARPSVVVAPDLLGCVLEHETAAGLVAVELTEVEAYAGQTDAASHAYRGKTARNAVMFGPPGHAYVYFTYGMYFCVNIVCLGGDSASAVLVRAGAVIEGEEIARARRTGRKPDGDPGYPQPPDVPARTRLAARDLARGPGRLCQALDIDRSLDGADICAAGSPLRVRSDRAWPPATARSEEKKEISSGPRVGVSRAAEIPWRFWITGEPTVSVYRPWVPRRKPVTP
jgi:DNA-3-methyladenine glycosylase